MTSLSDWTLKGAGLPTSLVPAPTAGERCLQEPSSGAALPLCSFLCFLGRQPLLFSSLESQGEGEGLSEPGTRHVTQEERGSWQGGWERLRAQAPSSEPTFRYRTEPPCLGFLICKVGVRTASPALPGQLCGWNKGQHRKHGQQHLGLSGSGDLPITAGFLPTLEGQGWGRGMGNGGLGTPWVWTPSLLSTSLGFPMIIRLRSSWLPRMGLEGEGRLVMNRVCIDMVLLLPVRPGPGPPVTSSPALSLVLLCHRPLCLPLNISSCSHRAFAPVAPPTSPTIGSDDPPMPPPQRGLPDCPCMAPAWRPYSSHHPVMFPLGSQWDQGSSVLLPASLARRRAPGKHRCPVNHLRNKEIKGKVLLGFFQNFRGTGEEATLQPTLGANLQCS